MLNIAVLVIKLSCKPSQNSPNCPAIKNATGIVSNKNAFLQSLLHIIQNSILTSNQRLKFIYNNWQDLEPFGYKYHPINRNSTWRLAMLPRALVAIAVVMMIATNALAQQPSEEFNTSKAADYMDRLAKDLFCIVTNQFVFREKSLLMVEMYSAGVVTDLEEQRKIILEPLGDDALILETDRKMLLLQLKTLNIDMVKVEASMGKLTSRELSENVKAWSESFGAEAAATYLNMIANKQRACKKHIEEIAGKKT